MIKRYIFEAIKMTDKVQDALKTHSDANIDGYISTSSFQDELAEALRGHIHIELQGWFFFRKLAADCCRANIALHGFGALFTRCATECFADANWLEKYLVQRGGVSKPTDIPAPQIAWPDSPVDPVGPVSEALKIEKGLLEDLQRLCRTADKCGDNAVQDIIESRFLAKETRHVKDMGDLLQQCVRVSKQTGLGLYHLDKELRETHGVTPWSAFNSPDASDKHLRKVTQDLYDTAV